LARRVLAVVAHPDDEVLGPGGTLARHVAAGDEVEALILADGKSSRDASAELVDASHRETQAAADVLGLRRARRLDLPDQRLDSYELIDLADMIAAAVQEVEPHVVYTHHADDLNLDHELVARACLVACRPQASAVEWVFAFSTLSSTEAGYGARTPFVPSVFVDIESTLELKIAAMTCYASELREPPHPRSLDALRAEARLRGAFGNCAAAEGFAVVRGTLSPGG
jgi:N-acetylglucosamine malate deacetylase 1